jgi:MFS family permease
MLKHLHIGYLGFATLIATAFVAKIIALSRWGEVAKRQGAQRLLLLGGALIVPAPMLWIVSSNYFWLLGVQTLSGIGWAAYELGFFLMLFESVPIAGRVRLLTIYNLANTSAWCIGATLGGLLLHQMGTSSLGYYTLFAISTVGRSAALIFLLSCCGEAVQALQHSGRRLLRLPQPQKVPELLSAQPSTVLTSGRQDLAA